MKKLAIFLAIMLIPFSAFALDTISDNDLNDVTGQAGVSIYTNSIQIVKTGVTTTYTDIEDEVDNRYTSGDANQFSIVSELTNTKIFFKGIDPIMIDVIEMQTLADYLGNEVGVYADDRDFGDSAVMITLPNAIEIINQGSVKTYYSGDVADDNRMITVTTTGGTTLITHAQPNWKFQKYIDNGAVATGSYAVYEALDDSAMAGTEYESVWQNSGKSGYVTGTTSHADMSMTNSLGETVNSQWDDLDAAELQGDHSDQIVILITAHED
jgi:hypothetical protein